MASNLKYARADQAALEKIFTIPESETSTLGKIEKKISENLIEFLKETIIAGNLEPEDLERAFSETHIPENPTFVSDHADFLIKRVISQSVHTASPTFVGHMTSALPYFMLPLAKIMMALNQNLVKIETSKAFTPLERQVVGMLHRLFYLRSPDFYSRFTHSRNHALGVFCSGGTVANLTCLWLARNRFLGPKENFQGIAEEGIYAAMRFYGYEGLAVLVSKMGHYSLRKSCNVLGLGKNGLIPIEVDEKFKLKISSLKEKIQELKSKKIGIMAMVGIAGTTETGTVDPLHEMAEIAHEQGVFFHVDAAWGGPTFFSDKYKNILQGISQADSLTVDAHKQLYVPMGTGIALFKNETHVKFIQETAQYVIREGSRDLGKFTLEGSRSGMALLVHAGLKIMGRHGYEILIDRRIENAKMFAHLISEQKDFEMISDPELNLLTYRFVPENFRQKLEMRSKETKSINDYLNRLTIQIQRIQRDAGKTFVSRTQLNVEKYSHQHINVFRVVLANPLTEQNVFHLILQEQREIGNQLLKTAEFRI